MADGAVKLATAYYELIAATPGAESQIASSLVPAAQSAGGKAGAAAGTSLGAGLLARAKVLLAPAAVGAAIAGVGVGLYKIGATFDDVTDTIRTGTGATGAALDGMVGVAKKIGSQVPAEWGKIGKTVADVNTRMGLSGDTLDTVSRQYLEAGRILGETVDINKTSAAFSAFKISGAGVVEGMDTLFRVSQATGVGMNQLASSVQANAPAMQTLGFSFAETASLAGTLDKAGLNSTQTMAAMSKGLVSLAKNGENPQAAFRRVTGEIESMVKAGNTAGALNLAGKVFGTKAATQFVGAVQSGTLALNDLVGKTGATKDTILGVAGQTADFAEKWQVVKNNAALALEPLGSAVFDMLGKALGGLIEPMQKVSAWMQANPAIAQAVVVGLGALAAGLTIASIAMWAMNSALLANPITWVIVGIVALIAAIVLLAKNWDSVVAWIKSVGSAFVSWWSSAWDSIKNFFINVWNGLIDWVKSVPSRILAGLAALAQLGGRFAAWVGAARDAAVGRFFELVSWVAGIPGRILGALGNLGSLLWNAGSQIISGLLDGLRSRFEAVKSFVGGIASWIRDHKGPKAYDLALLVPAGRWIMQGLGTGLAVGFAKVAPQVSAMADQLSKQLSVDVRPSVEGPPRAPSLPDPWDYLGWDARARPGDRVSQSFEIHTDDPELVAAVVAERTRRLVGVV